MSIFTFNRITVSAGQCALEYKDGTLGRVLPRDATALMWRPRWCVSRCVSRC